MVDARASVPLLDFKLKENVVSEASSSSSESVKIDVEEQDSSFTSLLHRSARDGNVDAMEKLISRRPDLVNVPDTDGFTALHYAAKYGHVKAVDLLLKKGAAVDVVGRDLFTPLHVTAKYCRPLALLHGAPTERSSVSQFIDASAHSATPRHMTADVTTAIVDLLVGRKADVNAKDSYGMTPLHHAAMKGNEPAAKALIKHHADVNAKAMKGTTPLLTACVHGSDEIIQMLLSNGADTSGTDRRMNSVYHIAAHHGRTDTLKLLLQHGRETGQRMLWMSNNEGKTPLRMAVDGNHPDTVSTILQLKPLKGSIFDEKDKYLLHEAAAKGYVEVVERLIQNGYDPRLRDDALKLPLHYAAQFDRADVVRLLVDIAILIEHGTDIFATDEEGRTAIHVGAKFNAIKVLRYILDLCREKQKTEGELVPDLINQPDHSQTTPMHIVCSNGYIEVSRVLYEYGAALDALDEDEETPLLLAAKRGETISAAAPSLHRVFMNKRERNFYNRTTSPGASYNRQQQCW
ncbi:ankyrin repeat protein [Teladorsagia circumcincta]|uniref:Ankyrin repeat protein n=1 Tax=Teladorsagia circumcincta TaxID=45464 RepID=A0A2G9UX96_TELCI|nr:ankyrin repeat protein [Teladorsagia circumcincta]